MKHTNAHALRAPKHEGRYRRTCKPVEIEAAAAHCSPLSEKSNVMSFVSAVAFLVDRDLTPCWFFLQGFFRLIATYRDVFGRLAVAPVRRWVGMVVRFGCPCRVCPVFVPCPGS